MKLVVFLMLSELFEFGGSMCCVDVLGGEVFVDVVGGFVVVYGVVGF